MADWIADAEVIQPEHGQLLLQLLLEPEPAMYSTDPQRNQCLISVVQNYEQEKKNPKCGVITSVNCIKPVRGRAHLRAIGGGRKQAEGASRLDGAQNLLPDLWEVHSAALGQQEREQEENPGGLESPLAQITIEQKRIAQNAAEGEQGRLHSSSKLRDRTP